MKRFITVLMAAVLAIFYIRHEAIDLAKKSYKLGCDDAALKLEKVGDLVSSQELYKFCEARSDMMNKELDLL